MSEVDDFMESIGLDVRPANANDALMTRLTGGVHGTGYREIHNYRYWIRHELFAYFDLTKNGCLFYKNSIHPETKVAELVPFSKLDFIKTRTKYYLRMKYHPYFFTGIPDLGKADIDVVCGLILDHPDIKPLLTASEEDLPKNH